MYTYQSEYNTILAFEETLRHLLPRLVILNPPCITKVSCFENFKDLAFSLGSGH